MDETQRPADDGQQGYHLPVPEQPNGPAVRALIRRSAVGAGVLGAAALVGLRRARSDGGRALALGALAPGAGYAYTGNPGRLVASAGAFGAAFGAWFATGNILAPPAVWAASALDARRLARTGRGVHPGALRAVPAVLGAATAAGVVLRRRAFRAAQARGRARAAYLRTAPRLDPRPASTDPRELTPEDLGVRRALLDRLLQPTDAFDGFDIVDQFQTAAIRYQLVMSQWALALSQMEATPAFHGYLAEAQRRAIEKLTLPRVWRYWAYEQTWGNLSLDWDPVKRDNIMLSGYMGVSLGLYESTTGDTRYRQPGSLDFRLGRRHWPYDHDRLAAAVAENFRRAHLTLYPCEPNWVYSGCNMTGINTLLLSDRLHGTTYLDELGERFRQRFHDEFVTPDGRITAIRSARLGVTLPMLTSTLADAATASMLHAFDPDLAQRTWTIVRRELVDATDPDDPKIALRGWDAIDTGNYRPGEVGAFASVLWAAAEMGDDGLCRTLQDAVDRRFEPVEDHGSRWYAAGSTQANAMLAIGRFSRPGAYRRAILEGPGSTVLAGPCLAQAPYPAVQVARAGTDGHDLRLVLRPGDGGGRHRLGLARLRPGARYEVKGAADEHVVAGADGTASVEVDLRDRHEVVVTPTA